MTPLEAFYRCLAFYSRDVFEFRPNLSQANGSVLLDSACFLVDQNLWPVEVEFEFVSATDITACYHMRGSTLSSNRAMSKFCLLLLLSDIYQLWVVVFCVWLILVHFGANGGRMLLCEGRHR